MSRSNSETFAAGADLMTAARLAAALVVVPLIASGNWTLVALVVSLAWLSDLLDGRLARLSGTSTRLGAHDLLADTVFGSGVVIGLIARRVVPWWVALVVLTLLVLFVVWENVAAAMLVQLTGFVPLLIELWSHRPVTWWTPFLVASLAAVVDWRRLVFVEIPAFICGLTGRSGET